MVVEIKHTFEREAAEYYSTVCFPALGFAGEQCYSIGDIIVYECVFQISRAVIWRQKNNGKHEYAVNLYCLERTDQSATHYEDRVCRSQEPIIVADALEAQLAIFYLLQTYLPIEVTHMENVNGNDCNR